MPTSLERNYVVRFVRCSSTYQQIQWLLGIWCCKTKVSSASLVKISCSVGVKTISCCKRLVEPYLQEYTTIEILTWCLTANNVQEAQYSREVFSFRTTTYWKLPSTAKNQIIWHHLHAFGKQISKPVFRRAFFCNGLIIVPRQLMLQEHYFFNLHVTKHLFRSIKGLKLSFLLEANFFTSPIQYRY